MHLGKPARRVLRAALLGWALVVSGLWLAPAVSARPRVVASDPAESRAIADAATLALYALVNQPPTPATSPAEPPVDPAATPASAPAEPVVTYADRLNTLASLVGPRAGVDATELAGVWTRTDQTRMIAVITAIGQVGDRYKARGSGPDAFDCSGLVWFSWRQAGVNLPRTSSSIIQATRPIRQHEVQPGDVVWRPGHVMMALGLGEAAVDAPESGRTVQVAPWGTVRRFGSPV